MALEGNFGFIKGQDMTVRIAVRHKNITGWALTFAVAASYGATAVITKAVGSGITITDGANGVLEVLLNDTDTDGLDAGTTKAGKDYVWDIKRTDSDQEAVLAWGTLTLKPKVAP